MPENIKTTKIGIAHVAKWTFHPTTGNSTLEIIGTGPERERVCIWRVGIKDSSFEDLKKFLETIG